MKKALILTLKILGYVWLIVGIAIVVISITVIGINEGFSAVQDILSPFNALNWGLTFLLLAPGVGALMLADKLQRSF